MTLLLIALGLFGLSWIIHFVWWRCYLPKHHTRALGMIFTGVPAAILAGFAVADELGVVSMIGWASIALFHGSATLCYLITYAGVEETSPSLVIVRALEQAGANGATVPELEVSVAQARLTQTRMASLIRDGFVVRDPEGYRLTERGRSAADFARRIARVFNLGPGA